MMNNLVRRSVATTRPTLARSLSTQAKKNAGVALTNRYVPTLFADEDDFFGWPQLLRGGHFHDPFAAFTTELLPSPRLASLPAGYDINEKDGAYQISVDLPGVKATDMNVTLEDDGKVLRIAGGRKVEKEGTTTNLNFKKLFTVGSDIDASKITANLNDGVLTLTAPKKEEMESQAHTIAITEGPLPVLEGNTEGDAPKAEEKEASDGVTMDEGEKAA